ncbi:hypothetical protein X560_0755 [Listeria fleischmannii 1991]|jgi:predicted nucleic acid-binding protein|uniref:Uncharacterized protein n=4 Tax=Listeria fleischmannii TaxID=1069827 RepID=A0A2X3H9C9_9LIST|nr:hypothetical protein [Listeria fleischmannii]EIA20661.1 putative secreted protein [Listeria fleischmannii subsp. coloradonensis]EMG28163.1 hypothetical protein LFLEISCH_07088 [Listeria fleischmannii subsp. fleischmannii LU2006-1]EUJ60942.1 hypothetical protein MCOL2_04691 [Listeria fleischmannii FSL S10-1203]KMT60627.1 hypothetical protein X560_0755 [Listeria fleischmannii 1991]MBC1399690.1 hypothetical protein [Listeria fleischmannii]
MTTVIIILLAVAIILFVVSFIKKGDSEQTESEFEEVASQLMHENYELKKRVSALEKAIHSTETGEAIEVITEETTEEKDEETSSTPSPKMQSLLKKQVITLYTSGIATDEIVEQSSLPKEEVEQIIEEYLEH